jgi:hypothetical protein
VTAWERFRRDLRTKRNLDVYVTILVALGTSVLSAFDVVPTSKLTSAVLAVLAVLAFSTLATRTAVEEIGRGEAWAGVRLHADFPDDLKVRRGVSRNVYLAGVSLTRTLETSYQEIERNLLNGGKVRILLTDPAADDAAVGTQNKPSRPQPDEIRDEIRQSLRLLTRLSADTGGDLEVRTTTTALKFGLNYFDISKSNALLCVQLYSFRQTGESRPILVLTHADGDWFESYRDQAERLWDEAAFFDMAAAGA